MSEPDKPRMRDGMSPRVYGQMVRQQILDFIRDNTGEDGKSPNLKEIAAGIDKSTTNTARQINTLREEGRLDRDWGPRTYKVIDINTEEAPHQRSS
jgi:SOS-response transcriptional repressor LexA